MGRNLRPAPERRCRWCGSGNPEEAWYRVEGRIYCDVCMASFRREKGGGEEAWPG
jgi:hypothetical protein